MSLSHAFLRTRLGVLLVLTNTIGPVLGQPNSLQPTPVAGEARMVTFDFDDDRIFKVLVRPKNATQLQFAAGENVTYVSAGNKTDFVITVPSSRAFIEIKPKWDETSTNLLVVTNRHTYHIDLQSTGEGRKWYARVGWTYEDASGLDATILPGVTGAASTTEAGLLRRAGGPAWDVVTSSVALDHLYMQYDLSGEAEFRPLQVFDDGVRTFLRLPENLQELPAMFMITPDSGDLALINYVAVGDFIVAQRVMDRFVLQLGKSRIQIQRHAGRSFWSRWLTSAPSSRSPFGDLGDRSIP